MPRNPRPNIGRRTRNAVRIRRSQIANEQSRRRQSQHDNVRQILLSPWLNKLMSGFSYNPAIDYNSGSVIGNLQASCNHCHALLWRDESKGLCCANGKVRLDPINPPELIQDLLTNNHAESSDFLQNIRAYNILFSMTSFGAKQVSEGNFMPTFKIQGQVYHRIGSLLPENSAAAQFLQIYFIADYAQQLNHRVSVMPNLQHAVVDLLQAMLLEHHSYIQSFKRALQLYPNEPEMRIVIDANRRPEGEHARRFNCPVVNEVAVLLVGSEHANNRDIILHRTDNTLHRINETHRSYDTLQYPLIFCRGEDGYSISINQFNPTTGESTSKKVSALQFYCYRLMLREGSENYLHRYKMLLNQFIVDMFAKIESERLLFIKLNQRKLRADNYIHLHDAIQQDGDINNLGQAVILPSTYVGGPRYMHERTQDAFAYVRKFSRPHLFITFTTNPKWEEIQSLLFPGQQPQDRHDIICRVFHLKLKALMKLITKENIFGPTRCHMYSIEWQKRGLPHAHILIWLINPIHGDQIDQIISAELPDPQIDPTLYEIVKKHMIHGPCGYLNPDSPCMKNRKCSKKYPHPLIQHTVTSEDGYPLYRRRSTGINAELNIRGRGNVNVDNCWIVPYSPVLLKAFNAHINVELCSSVKSIKYICKYVNKGSDQATFVLQNEKDEVVRYQTGRYISSSEAIWRIFSFPIHVRYPPVHHLAVHLENMQRVYYTSENLRNQLENPRHTTLTAFFQLCQTDSFASTLLYEEVSSFYVFNKQEGKYTRRKTGSPVDGYPEIKKESDIGRLYTIHPNFSECFHLRLLLTVKKGPTSFENLRTVNGRIMPTFKSAALELGLLEHDIQWENVLSEAMVSHSAKNLRKLFIILLLFCNLADPMNLWLKFRNAFSEDILHTRQRLFPSATYSDDIYNECLCELQNSLYTNGGHSLSSYNLPSPENSRNTINFELFREKSYDRDSMQEIVLNSEPLLNIEQKTVYDQILESVRLKDGKIFFLDAPGGCGKTFLTKLLLAKLRSVGKIALAVASSGIASTLLPGGRTAHAMFKIPLDTNKENAICNITRSHNMAKVLEETELIVWDECSMINKRSVEAVDRTLQDICRTNKIMGGITVVFTGDFRQILPVVPRGTSHDEISACLKNSYIWTHIVKLSLSTNMRVLLGGHMNNTFAQQLLSIGNGTVGVQTPMTLTDDIATYVPTIEELIAKIYPDLDSIVGKDPQWFLERAILTTTNEEAFSINKKILSNFPGLEIEYTSINSVVDLDDAVNYPNEFLNQITAPGLPAHKLLLKIGAPVILLRNLDPPKLCNGTRLIVKNLYPHVIVVQLMNGSGEIFFIPRIPLIPTNYPFKFKRCQFPLQVCFAMTINKAQGQTLKTVGVDLRSNCFSHGQLYVACSRVGSNENLYVCSTTTEILNVVYPQVLI